jgi:hypothetical protein
MNKRTLLKKNGWVSFSGILSPEEVKKARSQLLKIFSQPSPFAGDVNRHPSLGNIYIDPFTRYRELGWILFHPKLLTVLKSLLGDDFVVVPEMSLHDSGYGVWHKDTTSQESNGHMFHWDQDFMVVQVGIYLQDNTFEYGGGLDVVTKSHKKRDRFANVVKPSIWERGRIKLHRLKLSSNPNPSYTIPSKAGDMVVFNLRLDHKASAPAVTPIPEANRKLSIFMVCSENNRHARSYTDYISSRPDYQYLNNHKYPADLLREAEEHSVKLMDV